MNPTQLGDLLLLADPPARTRAALDLIGDRLHPELAKHPKVGARSQQACILAALTVRDLLLAAGQRARVRPCRVQILRRDPEGTPTHELVIGDPDDTHASGHWNGHMIVETGELAIDPTLGQARRPQWPDLPLMLALPTLSSRGGVDDADPPGDAPITHLRSADRDVEVRWWPLDDKSWTGAPDARAQRRRKAVQNLAQKLA